RHHHANGGSNHGDFAQEDRNRCGTTALPATSLSHRLSAGVVSGQADVPFSCCNVSSRFAIRTVIRDMVAPAADHHDGATHAAALSPPFPKLAPVFVLRDESRPGDSACDIRGASGRGKVESADRCSRDAVLPLRPRRCGGRGGAFPQSAGATVLFREGEPYRLE